MFATQTPKETAPEKVLRLALELPETQDELEREAVRIERMLENLTPPITPVGEELQCRLGDAMEFLIEGIDILIEARAQDEFDAGCSSVLQCHALVQELQTQMAELEEDVLLIA